MYKSYHKKTILQVPPSLSSTGVERNTIDIAKYIILNNYQSVVASSGGMLLDTINSTGSTHYLINTNSKNPFVIWYNHIKLANIIRKHKVDIIHVRSRVPAFSAYLAARKTNIKLITTFHGFYSYTTPLKKLYNSILVKGDIVIVVSNFIREHIITNYNVAEDKIRVVHRGIDHEYFSPDNSTTTQLEHYQKIYNIPKDTCVIFVPSKITEWRGHEVILEALNMIKHHDFYCIMAGDTASNRHFTNKIYNMIRHFKLQSKVQIFNAPAHMPTLYNLSNIVLCCPIQPDATGKVIIEAQAMGKIVIASDIGSTAEIIDDEVTGLQVQTNHVAELAQKIKYVLSNINSGKIQAISQQARRSVVEKFSLQRMLSKTLSIYNEV